MISSKFVCKQREKSQVGVIMHVFLNIGMLAGNVFDSN